MNLHSRSTQKELLDAEGLPFEDIKRNMMELEFINKYLGGHEISISGLKSLCPINRARPIHIMEIGSGGGDNIAALYHWGQKRNIILSFTGVDLNPECIAYARHRWKDLPVKWICADYREIDEEEVDICFNSLFCHHFTDADLIEMLKWMHCRSRLGFFINDLQRHPFAYHSIKILTKLFSKSYLVRNDAPLSVARGFSRAELEHLLRSAGVNASLQWKWAFRWLMICTKQNSSYA